MNDLMLDSYHSPLIPEKGTIRFNKNPCRLKRWAYPVIGSPVTCYGLDPYHRVKPLRRWIAEQESPAYKPKPARRRPGRSRSVV
jgi:hypothetical protein